MINNHQYTIIQQQICILLGSWKNQLVQNSKTLQLKKELQINYKVPYAEISMDWTQIDSKMDIDIAYYHKPFGAYMLEFKFKQVVQISLTIKSIQFESIMPSHLPSKTNTLPKLKPLSHKPIKKDPKKQIQRSATNSSECECDENTMSEIMIEEAKNEGFQCVKEITRLIRSAMAVFRYSLDTHFVCLSLLSKIKFQISINRVKLLTAALLLLAGKVHEFRTPKFTDILSWLDHDFKKTDLIRAEAELLLHFNFNIPVTLDLKNVEQLSVQVQKLQKALS